MIGEFEWQSMAGSMSEGKNNPVVNGSFISFFS
jgi:hypothetical protein